MNFLAHFHLSSHSEAAIVGSWLGDFVKGGAHRDYADEISDAILLHRHIDSFTDHHEIFLRSKRRLSPPFRRYAGILIDVFYDHFLARHWDEFHDQHLDEFCQNIYGVLADQRQHCPAEANRVAGLMAQHDWMGSYRHIEGVDRALHGISRRLRRANPLAAGVDELRKEYLAMEQDFFEFYPLLRDFSEQRRST